LAAGLIVMAVRWRQVGTVLRSNGPLLVFFLYCAISVFWSDFPFVAFKRWNKALGDLIMVLIVLTDPDPSAAIKRLLARTGFVLLPASILLIRYYGDLGRVYDRWEGTLQTVGVTTNKNMLGMTCLVLGLGALWRFLKVYRSEKSALRTKQLVAQGVLVALVVWLLSIANSMTSIVCFALAGSLIVATSIPAMFRNRTAIHALVLFLLFIACSPLFSALGSGFVEVLGRDPTLTGRTFIWEIVLDLAGNPLVGTGFESFWLGERLEKVWNIFFFPLNEAHNGYIEVYLNLGWVGLAMLAAIMMAGYRDILRSFHQGQDMAKLRLAYFVAALAYSLTEAGFRMMSPIWIFFLLAVTAIPKASVPQVAAEWQPESFPLWSATASPVPAKASEPARF
jgi:O-antigen ligase